jgi:hypothetical protein
LVIVTPNSAVSTANIAPVFALADLQAGRQVDVWRQAHWPASRFSFAANGMTLLEHPPDASSKPAQIYLRAETDLTREQVHKLYRITGLNPQVVPSNTAGTRTFEIRLLDRVRAAADVLGATDPFAPEFEQIRAALRRPGFYLHSTSEMLWELTALSYDAVRTIAQVADARARAYLVLSRPAEAWRELAFANDFRRCLESNSWYLVSAMMDVAVAGMFVAGVEEGYTMHRWTTDQYAEIQFELEKVNVLPIVQYSFAGERAGALQFLELSFGEYYRWVKLTPETALASVAPHGWVAQNKKTIAELFQMMIETVDDRAGTVSPQFAERTQTTIEREFSHWTPYNHIASLAIPYVSKPLVTMARIQTRANLAACAFALERYRVKYGQYPEKLESLAPEFKAKVPHDIVNGEPLKYRREAPDRFILYSIGWNLKDDGGKEADNKGSGDWVWTSSL